MEVATHWIHVWSKAKVGGAKGAKTKSFFADRGTVKDLAEQIFNNFLDDCFGNKTRCDRDEFISCI